MTYHVGGHAVTNEEDDVLGPLLGVKIANNPLGGGLLAIVVAQSDGVGARLVEGNLAVRLGRDVDDRGLVGILGKEVLIPVERPLLERRLLDTKGIGKVLSLAALLGNGHLELLIRLAVVGGFGAIDGSMNLDTQVKQLAREEVALVRRQNTSQRRACSQALEGLGRDGRQRGCEEADDSELGNHLGLQQYPRLYNKVRSAMTAEQLRGDSKRSGMARLASPLYTNDGQSGPRVMAMPGNAKYCTWRPLLLASLAVCGIAHVERMERDARHLVNLVGKHQHPCVSHPWCPG